MRCYCRAACFVLFCGKGNISENSHDIFSNTFFCPKISRERCYTSHLYKVLYPNLTPMRIRTLWAAFNLTGTEPPFVVEKA